MNDQPAGRRGTARRRTRRRRARNFIRLTLARLQAESSRNMYSEQGFEALIRPEFGQVCQRLMVRVVLHARIAAGPGRLGHLAEHVAGRIGGPVVRRVGDPVRGPGLVGLDRLA